MQLQLSIFATNVATELARWISRTKYSNYYVKHDTNVYCVYCTVLYQYTESVFKIRLNPKLEVCRLNFSFNEVLLRQF